MKEVCMTNKNTLGQFIRNYVTVHSITINDLARMMEVPHSTVARWASGKTEPTLKQLNKLAGATNTDLCHLVNLIYPQPRRGVDPDVVRLAEQIAHLGVPAKELIDSLIFGLSLKNNIQDTDIS
jgi:transcriptional regulator with XRE-family HTH domain